MSDKPNPADLPETFTIEDLEKVFDPEEIEAMKADDPELFDVTAEDAAALDEDPLAPAKAAVDAAKAPAAQAQQQPVIADVPDTTAAEQRIAQVKAQRTELRQKYDDGEMTAAEMDAALDKLMNDQAAAMAEVKSAEQIIVANHQTREQQWMGALDAFKASGNEALFSDVHAPGFDKALKAVTGDPDNAGLPFATMIQMAARQHAVAYEGRTGQALPVKTVSGKAAPGTEAKRTGPRQDARPDPIDTLGGVNGDGQAAVEDSTYTAIDRRADIDPEGAIDVMRRMTPDQLDAYLAR